MINNKRKYFFIHIYFSSFKFLKEMSMFFAIEIDYLVID